MTINQLIKQLEKIRNDEGKRLQVCAAAKDLLDASNGVFQIANISSVSVESINQFDGDGWQIENRDGSERCKICVVLR